MHARTPALLPLAALIALALVNADAAPGTVEFARDVRPLLARRCLACHSTAQQKGGLRMESQADLLRGGDSGAAVVPHKSRESLLIRVVTGQDPKRVMPPAGLRLAAGEITLLARWIDSLPSESQHSTLNTQHPTPNTQHSRTPILQHSTLDGASR